MAIVLQETLRAVFYAPFYAALALGAYRQEGVEVRLVTRPRTFRRRARSCQRLPPIWPGAVRCACCMTYDQQRDCDLVCFCEVVTRDPFYLVGRWPKPDFQLQDLFGLRLGHGQRGPDTLVVSCRRTFAVPRSIRHGLSGSASDRWSENCASPSAGRNRRRAGLSALRRGAGRGRRRIHLVGRRGSRARLPIRRCMHPVRLLSTRRRNAKRMVRAIYRTLKVGPCRRR